MKLHPHRKAQIAAVFVFVFIFIITVLYSKGTFDLTFVDRPDGYGSLKEVDGEKVNTEDTESEETTGSFEDEFHDVMEDMLEDLNPKETDFNPNDLPQDTIEQTP